MNCKQISLNVFKLTKWDTFFVLPTVSTTWGFYSVALRIGNVSFVTSFYIGSLNDLSSIAKIHLSEHSEWE